MRNTLVSSTPETVDAVAGTGAPADRSPTRHGLWRWVRPAAGAGIVVVLLVRLGTGPFLAALRAVDGWAVAAAVFITALTTTCCAWRWRVVAERLGVEIGAGTAVSAYYRSQLLNATLPGGIVGDVHRGLRHGREVHAVGRSLRSVAWERSLGQLVQVGLTALVLLTVSSMQSPLQAPGVAVAAALALVCVLALAGTALLPQTARIPATGRRGGVDRLLAAARTVGADVRGILREPRALAVIVLASTLVIAGHTAIFLVAMRSAGADVPLATALPLGLVVLLAAALPTNVAGWGPREGAAAWVFGATGLSAEQGVTVAVVYGVLALVATLPGVVPLLARRRIGDA